MNTTASPLIVIKIGGGKGIDVLPLLTEIAELVRSGTRVVLVHGGSHETNTISDLLGHPPRFLTSPLGHTSRRTDQATLDIFKMVYCGKINKGIVEHLRRHGIDAVGLSGIDGGLWQGKRKDAIRSVEEGRVLIVRDDLTGTVDHVDARLLNLLLNDGRTPVLCPPAVTEDGIAINVDADRAAARTAIAMGASEFLLLSNIPGVLRDPSDNHSLIANANTVGLSVVRAAAQGRMKNKVMAAQDAVTGGVQRVVIGSANGENSIARARSGAGTIFEAVLV